MPNPPAPRTTPSTPPLQCAAAVLMVRPRHFGWNPQTSDSNWFQPRGGAAAADTAALARAEFDGAVAVLRGAGVAVHVAEDCEDLICPDAVFPNNWVGFHPDGRLVLYPMLARNRRLERRYEILMELCERTGTVPASLLDLTHHELAERYLEGTGSVVFDHTGRIAYACRSPRTHALPLAELCAELDYTPCEFDACDRHEHAIYHTNVMLAIGSRFAAVGAATIAAAQREEVIDLLGRGGRRVIQLSLAQIEGYAGNILELRAADGAAVLAMSAHAHSVLAGATLDALAGCVDRILVAPIPTIESIGGGSLRCMIAEVFWLTNG